MPEAISLGFLAGYAAINMLVRSNNGVSAEAGAVGRSASQVLESAERSLALFGKRAEALTELHALVSECGVQGSGRDSTGLNPMAIEFAEEFLRALPDSIATPEMAPEPGGSISLDWIQSKNRVFSLSIGNTRRLPYAWLDGTDRGSGVSRFDGQKIPARILEGIVAITNGESPFRPA